MAIDRIAGTTVLIVAAGLLVWLLSQAGQIGILNPIGAAESSAAVGTYIPPKPNLDALAARDKLGPMTMTVVRQLQSRLQVLGFDPGAIDGVAGGRTLDALNHYRETKDLTRVSQISYATAAGLLD